MNVAVDETTTRTLRPWMWLIPTGVSLVGVAIFCNFELARRSSVATLTDSEFYFLEFVYIPMLMLGLLASVIGSVNWAKRARLRNLVVTGLLIGTAALIAMKVSPINIHGWTGGLMFVFPTALLVGILFLIFAVVRFISGSTLARE
jgi:hypothetical protein